MNNNQLFEKICVSLRDFIIVVNNSNILFIKQKVKFLMMIYDIGNKLKYIY